MYNKLVCYIVQIKPIVTISINDDAATSPTNATTQCTWLMLQHNVHELFYSSKQWIINHISAR